MCHPIILICLTISNLFLLSGPVKGKRDWNRAGCPGGIQKQLDRVLALDLRHELRGGEQEAGRNRLI